MATTSKGSLSVLVKSLSLGGSVVRPSPAYQSGPKLKAMVGSRFTCNLILISAHCRVLRRPKRFPFLKSWSEFQHDVHGVFFGILRPHRRLGAFGRDLPAVLRSSCPFIPCFIVAFGPWDQGRRVATRFSEGHKVKPSPRAMACDKELYAA